MAINIKDAPYNAKGDAKNTADGVMTSGSNILFSASSTFTSGDIGKTIWVVDNALSKLTGQTVITGLGVDAQHVTLGVNAPRNATGAIVTYGTDDTNAFLTAYAASRVDAASTIYESVGSFLGLFIPSGGYIVTGKFYTTTGNVAFSLIGESKSNTIIFPSPDCRIPNDASPVWMDVQGGTGEISGFSIVGPDVCLAMVGGNQTLINITFAFAAKLDIHVTRVGSLNAATSAIRISSSFVTGSVFIQNLGNDLCHQFQNLITGLYMYQSNGEIEVYLSNMSRNFAIDGCIARQGLGTSPQIGLPILNVYGFIDEQTGPHSTEIFNASEVNFNAVNQWTGGTYAIDLQDTSKVWLTACDIGCYFLGNIGAQAINIAPGANAIATMTTFRAVSLSSPVSINNVGRFTDGGGNNALNGGTGTNVPVPWLQAFTNPTQIWRS